MCYSALVQRDLDLLRRRYGAIVVRSDFDAYDIRSRRDPKTFPPAAEQIYPGHYAPVIFERDGERHVMPMRYGAYAPFDMGQRQYTTFNARRDNLTSPFWSEAFLRHHGFVVLKAFYEWVEVKDLLTAGCVSIEQVQAEFARQAAERKSKLEAAGKKWKPTPTERKDPRERKIVIEFRPTAGTDVLAPVIFSFHHLADGEDAGFAIVTDEPPPFVAAAGHDRCPVFMPPESLPDWLDLRGKSAKDMDELLGRQHVPPLVHRLPEVA